MKDRVPEGKNSETCRGSPGVFSRVWIGACVGGKISHLKGLENSACFHQPDWKKLVIPKAVGRKQEVLLVVGDN